MKKIILVLVLISLSGCRVAKKSWVEENFTEKSTTQEIRVVQNEAIEKKFQEVSENFQTKFQEIFNSSSSSTLENESENTSVTGSITGEDGKEKSVTIGGTTIKSNGANVTFETISSKFISKEFQNKFQEISNDLQTERQFSQSLQTEINSLKSELADFRSTYESEKSTEAKEVTKRGFSFGVWLIVAIGIIVLIVLWYLKRKAL